jgi:molybdopterin converting factor small subunit
MITFNVAGFLTDFTNGQSQIVVDSPAATVAEALDSLWQRHLGLRDRVVNEQGKLRQHVNIFLNDENVRRLQLLETALPENCEITILPAVSGGESEPPRRQELNPQITQISQIRKNNKDRGRE